MQIHEIRTDGGTQPRAQLDFAVIGEYAELMTDGVTFDPVTVFYDGADYWLADGFHRVNAATQAGLESIDADVRQGTLQDAQWYSYSVNQAHGLRRSNPDKQRAVQSALQHPYAATMSDRQIAQHCGVSHVMVNSYRNDMKSTVKVLQSDIRIGTDGRTYNTVNIGRNGNGYTLIHKQWAKDNAEIGLDEFNDPLSPYEQQVADQYFVDGEEEETDLRYDPTQHMAYCKYCYTTHNDWVCEEDKAWECQRCTHRTRDGFMQIVEEPEPEAIDYGLDSNEWYTPIEFISAARSVMGSIDVDPASNDTAQEQIQAGDYFTKERDGLAQEWKGNVWLNPPYGDPLPWVEKLLSEFEVGRTKQAILLVNTANSPQWSRLLWHSMFTVCLLDRRVRFWRPDRTEAKGTAQDQMIWYIGYETSKFREEFQAYGAIR